MRGGTLFWRDQASAEICTRLTVSGINLSIDKLIRGRKSSYKLAATLEGDAVYAPFASFQEGKQKVPTLRNVDARATPDAPRAYMHNGWFKTLEGDATEAEALARGCWPAPEVAANVNHDELGDLRLTRAEEAAIVAFLRTLTDETAD